MDPAFLDTWPHGHRANSRPPKGATAANALHRLREAGTFAPKAGKGMKKLIADARGAVMAEYVVLLVLVAGGASATIVVIGMAMSRYFAAQQAWLLIPFP
jgi:Flp pilus assembly pilin Flp